MSTWTALHGMGAVVMFAANVQHVSRRQHRKLHQSDTGGERTLNFRGKHGHQRNLSKSDQLPEYTDERRWR